MEQDIQHVIAKRNWHHFLTRPYNLFTASLLTEWYLGLESEECFGVKRDERLFIEEKKNSMRYYLPKELLDKSRRILKERLQEPALLTELLNRASFYNAHAQALIDGSEHVKDLETSVGLLRKIAIYGTAFPYSILAVADTYTDRNLIAVAETLRQTSYYPQFTEHVVLPLAKKFIESYGVEGVALSVCTYQELVRGDLHGVQERISNQTDGMYVVYARVEGHECVFQTYNPARSIEMVEPGLKNVTDVRGTVAFPGIVRGIVRVIDTHNWQTIPFHEGEILVSINSNPTYMSLIKKCGALVTDEGGVACHAAIISRELRKPCIMGTRIATRLLKDGDMVEVDAEKGVVRKI